MKRILLTALTVLFMSVPCYAMEAEPEIEVTPIMTDISEEQEIAEELFTEEEMTEEESIAEPVVISVSEELSETFEEREKNWNHDYKMLSKGTFNCDYVDNYNNETKEPINDSECGTVQFILQSNLPCEPQKIFLQVVNTDTNTKFGMIALRGNDNKTYSFPFKLFAGQYLIDYIIAEGDHEGDFYIEPLGYQVEAGMSEIEIIPLKRQSAVTVNGTDYFLEDVEIQNSQNEENKTFVTSHESYNPSENITISENNVISEETGSEQNESTPFLSKSIMLQIAVIIICILIAIIFVIRKKIKRR